MSRSPAPIPRRRRKLRWCLVLVAVAAHPAPAFDTLWHLRCTQQAGQQSGFSEHAWKIMQLGNFSADFFGPVAEAASENLAPWESASLKQAQSAGGRAIGAAIFLHFDNLAGDLKSNSQFDYLFARLLESTQTTLAGYRQLRVDDRTRKALILVTLGASLHAVQDFYSHSDWIHQSFGRAVPPGAARAPTWFEFRSQAGQPEQWSFRVESGIYPPVAGMRNTHTHMNHDNSRLLYVESEMPGQPLLLQAQYHQAGVAPARGDAESDLAHQQFAVNTAAAASVEWIAKVGENPEARKAIESARSWNLAGKDSKLLKELEAGMDTEIALSCLAGKWDGESPQGAQGLICRTVLDRRSTSIGGGSRLQSEIIGLAAGFLTPFALKYAGMFWDIHGQYNVLDGLASGLSSSNGHYSFGGK